MPWSARFDDPIPLPNGRQLITLRDAAMFITKLPKAEHDAPEWQAAMEALILVAENGRRDHAGADRHHAGAQSTSPASASGAAQAGEGV